MTDNIFDQFDEEPAVESNPFDQFDDQEPEVEATAAPVPERKMPEMKPYEPTIMDRVQDYFTGGEAHKARASNELAARKIADEHGISIEEVYESAGGARPMLNPEGRPPVRALAEGTEITVKQLPDLPAGVANTVLRTIRGGDTDVDDSGWLDRAIHDTEIEPGPDADPNYESFQNLGKNLGYSLTTMVAGVTAYIAGSAATTPMGGALISGATTGAVAFRGSKDEYLSRAKEAMNAYFMKTHEREMTQAEWESVYDEYNSLANKYGAWEAIPEAVGNLVFIRAFALPLKGASASKLAKFKIRANEIAGRTANTLATENITEIATALGQNQAELEGGLTDRELSVGGAIRETVVPTTLLTAIMGGAGMAGKAGYNRLKRPPKFDQHGTPAGVLFTPTHKAAGGVPVQQATKAGKPVPDTFVDQTGKVIRDPSAVKIPPAITSSFDAGPLDAEAQAEAIKAEVFGGATGPEVNQGIINAIYGETPLRRPADAFAGPDPLATPLDADRIRQDIINQTPLEEQQVAPEAKKPKGIIREAANMPVTVDEQVQQLEAEARARGVTDPVEARQYVIDGLYGKKSQAEINQEAINQAETGTIPAPAAAQQEQAAPAYLVEQPGDIGPYTPQEQAEQARAEAEASAKHPVDRKKGDIFTQLFNGEKKWLVSEGHERGMGDTIHNSRAEAIKYRDEQRQRDADTVKREQELQREEAKAEAIEQENIDSYQGFLGGNALQAANRRKTLERKITYKGNPVTRKDLIESKVNDGWNVEVLGSGKRVLSNADGTHLNELDITKTGMDYAEHLTIKNQSNKQVIDLKEETSDKGEQGSESIKKDDVPRGTYTPKIPLPDNPAFTVTDSRVLIDRDQFDKDADNFGFPELVTTLDDNDPLLQDTQQKYQVNGEYVESRLKIHDDLIVKALNKGSVAEEGKKPVAILMGGGGASGKGTILAHLISTGAIPADGFVHADPDAIKAELQEYKDISASGDYRAAGVVHEESSDITTVLIGAAMAQHRNIIIDKTFGNQAKGIQQIKDLQAAGYEVQMIGVTVSPAEALIRALERYYMEGRLPVVKDMLEAHKGFNKAYPEYAKLLDKSWLYDNSGKRGIELATSDNKKLYITDEKGYTVVGKRGNLDVDSRTISEIENSTSENRRPIQEDEGLGRKDRSRSIPGDRGETDSGRDREVQGQPGDGDTQQRLGSTYGQNNKLVTSERAEELARRLKAKLGTLNAGFDPELLAIGAELAAYHVEAGARKFTEFTRAMVGHVGEEIKPYLKMLYNAARDFPGMDATGMTPATEVNDELLEAAMALAATNQQGAENERSRVSNMGESGAQADSTGPGLQPEQYGNRANDTNLAGEQSSNVPASTENGDVAEDGAGATGQDVGRTRPVNEVGNEPPGRTGASSQELADAGRRGGGRGVLRGTGAARVNRNYHIENPLEVIGGGQVARFDKNRAAIELYHTLQEEDRQPTDEEKNVIAAYTGWGSFGQELFQGSWAWSRPKKGWEKRDEWLREHLGKAEWESAQRSITNSHYTDPPTVMAMWDMVRRMGFEGGRVLEPAMGIGNFFSMMPKDLQGRSDLTGIEMDELTGGMAKMLFPDANISIKPYQDSKTPDNFYDLVIGNWPFENTAVADRRYNKINPFLHDYFYLKALDQVRPGGLVVAITSKGTMDKVGKGVRIELAKKAELVGAFRLPTGAFKEYAGTDVVTDIIILKKREQPLGIAGDPWIDSNPWKIRGETEQPNVNQYFHDNKDHVIGTIGWGDKTTYNRPGLEVKRPANMQDRLNEAVKLVPEGVYEKNTQTKHIAYITNHTDDRQGALVHDKGEFYIVHGEQLAAANDFKPYLVKENSKANKTKNAERKDQFSRLIALRKQYAELIHAEREQDVDAETARNTLKASYDSFVKKYGHLNDSYGLNYFKKIGDPFYPALAALETNTGTEDSPKWEGATILSRSTMRHVSSIKNPSIADAFVLARNESVTPTLADIAARANKSEAEVKQVLIDNGAVFETGDGDIIPHDVYLAGNVRAKLREAQALVEDGQTQLQRNVDALKSVLPADIPYHKIEVRMGAAWIDTPTYQEYVKHMLNLTDSEAEQINVTYTMGKWTAKFPSGFNHKPEAKTGYGSNHAWFKSILNHALRNQTMTIRSKDADGKEYVDEAKTKEVGERIAKVREDFAEWVWSDPVRRIRLEQEYNEARNAWTTPDYDGSFLNLDGMALQLEGRDFKLRTHIQNAIWRALVNRKSLNAHEVGTGKTFAIAGIAVESRRYGIAKKPLILAHNANSASVAAGVQTMYPGAKVLYIDNLSPKTIKTKLMQIANDDWDAVVMPHSLIGRLTLREDTLMGMAQAEISALEAEAQEAAEDDGVVITSDMWDNDQELGKLRSVTAKELVKQRNRIISQIKKQAQAASKEDAMVFEDLGIDMILVDESHEFKKPSIVTKMRMKGLNTQVSNRSLSLQFLTKYVRAQNGGANVHLFTGTPITNTLTEIYHQMRYIMDEEMAQADVDFWDGWFGSFASEVTDVELNAAAEYENITRLAAFINVPELRKMIGQYMDVVFADDMTDMSLRTTQNGKTMDDPTLTESERIFLENGRTEGATNRPYKKIINDTVDMTPEQTDKFEWLQSLARRWRQMGGKDRMEAMRSGSPESPIITEGLATKASFDVRLMDGQENAGKEGQAQDHENSKASRVVKNVKEIYDSHKMATQVIFAEIGMSKRVTRSVGRGENKRKQTFPAFSTVHDIVERLVNSGIPRKEIAIVDGSTSKEKRASIAEKMNSAEIRVVIGNTKTLGTGVNMQKNLRAMHHMDAPWMPGDLEQRNGRGQRQGNQWNTVLEYRYITDRLDGRRWQVLAIKARFIKAFLTANDDARVIEGEAASDEQDDILQTFSEASGDPRILIREKLKKKIERLQTKERIHSFAISDAIKQIDVQKDQIKSDRERLAQVEGASNTIVENLEKYAGDNFHAKLKGKEYTTRKGADKALADLVSDKNINYKQDPISIGTVMGMDAYAVWPIHHDEPGVMIEVGEETIFSKRSIQSIAGQLRSRTKMPAALNEDIESAQRSIERLQQVSKEPFAQTDQLASTMKELGALEQDMAMNPVPPPAWLRQGAPIDTEFYHKGKVKISTGHRWTNDGWFVMAGEEQIPYMEAKDKQGIDLYEERDFKAPEVVDKSKDGPVLTGPEEGTRIAKSEAGASAGRYLVMNKDNKPYAGQPDKGFETERDAENWARDEINKNQSDNKPDEPGVLYSRDSRISEKPTESIAPSRLKQMITRLQADYPGLRSVDFIVRDTQDQAFGAGSVKAMGRIKGGFYAGSNNIVLIAENISGDVDAMTVIRHELVGHYGLRRLLNKEGEFDQLLGRVYAARDGDLKALYDWVAKAYPDLVASGDARTIADEMLARAAESRLEGNLINSIFDALIRLLQKFGLLGDKATRTEVDAMVRLSARNLRKKTAEHQRLDTIKANPVYRRGSTAFRKWFGGSKVVDKNGEPLVVYHGTNEQFDQFSVDEVGSNTGVGDWGDGFYFTEDAGFAGDFADGSGGNIMPVYLSIENPATSKDMMTDEMQLVLDDDMGFNTVQEALEAKGFDGLIMETHHLDGRPRKEYVVFSPNQIKSAIGNHGTFDPNNPNILFRRVDEPVGSRLGMPEETYTDKFVRYFQNSFNRVKKLQQTIEERGGTVTNESDVYLAEELSSGKTTARLVQLDKKHMRPLVEQMQNTGITLEELDNYLMAKHAPERNAYIASINPDMQDGGSGMTTAQAESLIARMSDKLPALESLAARVYAVNNQTLDDMVAAGHLSQDTVNEWRQRWDYYIPLKGKEGEDGMPKGTGTGYSVRGAGIMDAMGRGEGNIAESPTAHAFAQAESTIVRTEKTKVGQALVQLIRDNPDPDFWTISKRTFQQFEDIYGEPFEGYEDAPDGLIEGLDYHRVKAVSKAERKAAEAEGRKPVPKVVYKLDPRYRNRDGVFAVMVEGQELLINIKDEIVAEQLKRMNSSKLNALVSTAGVVNRYLAMINTALNPEFVITNFERDFQTAMVNLAGEHSTGIAAKVMKSIPGAMRGIWQETFDTSGQSEWRNEFNEMQAEGGTIGFFGLEDIETKIKHIHEKLDSNNSILGRSKRGVLKVRDIVLDANLSVENAARLAAYKVSKEQLIANGMPAADAKKKAASLAKNLTVNFNRKGELAPVLNSLYLFYNASIQGSARIFTALQHKRVRQIVGGVMVMGFIQAMFNRGLGGDDEDDIPKWDKISDYTKQTHMIFMVPGMDEPLKIKLPYGYNVFHYTGTAIHDMMFNPRKSVPQTAMSILSATMNAFNPIQGADLMDTITPTVLKPFEQDVRNINFMGSPNKPENPFDSYDRPESQKSFKSTNPQLKEMMAALNEMTGGDETHPGLIDISPETVKHYVGWLTGGAGLTVTRALSTATNVVTGEEIDSRNIPLWRTLKVPQSSSFDTQRFYEAVKQVAAVEAQIKIYKGTDRYADYRADNYEVHKLAFHVPKYKRRIKRLREQRDKAYADQDYQLAREISEKMRIQMMEFSKKYDDAIAAQE